MNFEFLLLGLVCLPWLSAVLVAWAPKKNQVLLSIACASLFFCISLGTILGPDLQTRYAWFTVGGHAFSLAFWANAPAKMLLLLVSIVGLFVQIFSSSYMAHEKQVGRYYTYLHLFVGAMTLLILSNQIYIFYGAWELVGACSYLLISFWHEKPKAIRAAKKAFLLNRISDIALLFGLIGLQYYFKTDLFSEMQGVAPWFVGLAVIAGGIGKSAQFPLMSWLPDAMEGPTPASALIHAATMVAAGVYIAVRVFPIVGEETHLFMGFIGVISLIAGALLALFQNDIKKALAYSTISQLGLMWLGMGSSASLFHLWVHGIFKAGLFLSAGAVIHYIHQQKKVIDAQSLSFMGGLRKALPIPALAYLIFGAGMMGIPMTSGFYSKENIAGILWESSINSPFSAYYYVLLVGLAIGMVLTSTYISRQFILIFLGINRAGLPSPKSPFIAAQFIPISVLILLSLFIWVTFNPMDAHGSGFLAYFNIQTYHIPSFWLGITAGSWLIGISISYATRNWIPAKNESFMPQFWPQVYSFGFFNVSMVRTIETRIIDPFIHQFIRMHVILAHLIAWLDNHLIDGVFVGIPTKLSVSLGSRLRTWQSAKLHRYWVWVFICFILLFLYRFF